MDPKKNDDVRTQTREIFTGCSGPRLQSIGRGRISREGALDVRKIREFSVTKFAEKKKRQNFGSETAVFNGELSLVWPRKNQLLGGV